MAGYIEFKKVKQDYFDGKITAEQAIKIYRKMNTKCPTESIQFEIAMIEFNNGKKEKNIEKLKKFSQSANSHISNRAKMALSSYYVGIKDIETAKQYISSVDDHDFSAAKSRQFATIEREAGNYDAARRNYVNSIKKDKDPKNIYGLGFLEYKYNHIDEAKAYVGILKSMGEYEYALKLKGVIEYGESDYENAKQTFYDLLGTIFDGEAKLYLGSIYFDIGNHEKSQEILESLIGTDYEKDAKIKIARIKDFEGLHEEALKDYNDNVVDDIDEYAYLDIVRALCNLGRYEEAKKYVAKCKDSEHKYAIISHLIYISLYEHNYREGLDIIKETSYGYGLENNFLWFYLYNKLYDTSNYKPEDLSYAVKQTLKYKSKWAIKHIKEHLSEDDTKDVHTLFNENVNIESLFFEVREKIQNTEVLNRNFTDKYIIETSCIVGCIDGYETNFVTVVTLPESKDILTMYPVVPTKRFKEMIHSRKR